MNRINILNAGAQTREGILHNYRAFGLSDGQELARRMIYEAGEVMSDLHGRKEAASILYNVADAITCKLPIEDFRLPAIPQAASDTTGARTLWRTIIAAVITPPAWAFLWGLLIGAWVSALWLGGHK